MALPVIAVIAARSCGIALVGDKDVDQKRLAEWRHTRVASRSAKPGALRGPQKKWSSVGLAAREAGSACAMVTRPER
jgi:hypothetical protein